jgi:hypothetical protein
MANYRSTVAWRDIRVVAALVALSAAFLASGSGAAATHEVRSETTVGISNDRVEIVFDLHTGALVSLKNLAAHDEYLKKTGGGGNPFRAYVNATEIPWFLKTDVVSDVPGALGGVIVEPTDCTLTAAAFERIEGGGRIRVASQHTAPDIAFELDVALPDEDIAARLGLRVRNSGKAAYDVMVAAPYLSGLCLGTDADKNLGIRLLGFGQSRGKAWANAGGMYGWQWGGQWNAVYDTSANEGLGLIVKDTSMQDKALCRHSGGVMHVFYPTKRTLQPGDAASYPACELLVHQGNWKTVARRYGEWFRSAYRLRSQPSWVDDVDLFIGAWIPSPSSVQEGRNNPGSFASFRDMPLLYLGDDYDLKEWAQYWQGVIRHNVYDAYNHTDGIYDFREDLGGVGAFHDGVTQVETIGRNVGLYVASRSVRADSVFFTKGYPGEGTKAEDWMIKTTPSTTFQSTGAHGEKTAHMCFRYGPWQDHLAATIGKALRETGCRYVRIDEFGSTWEPCWNPAHHHPSPFGAMPDAMEFLRKIRKAIDEVDPEILLFTEDATDMLSLYCDGTLILWAPGPDLPPVRLVVPNYIGLAYHVGEVDCALNGFIPGFPQACTRDGWWNPHHGTIWSPGLEKAPKNYPLPGPALRWHELGHSFSAAVRHGDPSDENPTADVADPEQWAGRLWKADKYWLLTCGDRAAIRPEKPVRVRVPALPSDVACAFEYDVETLAVRDAQLERVDGTAFVTTTAGFSAVLLPMPDCPPMIDVVRAGPLAKGQACAIQLDAFAPWHKPGEKPEVLVNFPGLMESPQRVTLPGTLTFTVPPTALAGHYKLSIQGDCLPLKRWLALP